VKAFYYVTIVPTDVSSFFCKISVLFLIQLFLIKTCTLFLRLGSSTCVLVIFNNDSPTVVLFVCTC